MRLGIVGTGRMAERMIACIAHRPGIRVTAIASARPDRAEALATRCGAAAFGSASDLAGHDGVDAVYVAGTNATHATAALAAIAAGKPVLVEKPLTVTPDETATLIRAAQTAHVLLVENLWTLTLPATRALIRQDGPGLLTFSFGYPTTQASLYARDAGVLRDRAVYGFALALHLFGPVETLQATRRQHGTGERLVDVAAMVQMRHTSGDLSQITVALDRLLANTITLSGSGGMTTLSPSIGAEVVTHQTVRPDGGPAKPSRLKSIPALRALSRWRTAPRVQRMGYGADPYLPMLDHFAALIRDGHTASPLIPLSMSRDIQTLIAQAQAQSQAHSHPQALAQAADMGGAA